MDGFDLFRRLGVGAKFDLKRFKADAEKFRLCKPQTDNTETGNGLISATAGQKRRNESEDEVDVDIQFSSPKSKKSKGNLQNDEFGSDSDHENTELQVLGNISSKDGVIPSHIEKAKKANKKKKDRKKLAQLKDEQVRHVRNQNRIHVVGSDIPEPIVNFEQLQTVYDVHPQIIKNIQTVGYSKPTPIQMQAIPALLNKREVMACAPTGSGKTAAFIIPILHHLKEPRNQGFRALVMAPTRELAKQIYREFQRLAEGRGFRIFYIEKSSTVHKIFGKKSKRFDILVSTPNRLVYMLKEEPPVLKLDSVEWLIVDESDKLFEEGKTGFRDQLAVIYKACESSNVRRAMFSATFAYDVEEWCKLNLDNVLHVDVGSRNAATDTIEQELMFVGTESGKLIAIRDIIRKGLKPPVLIFVQSKDRAKELFHELIYDGMNVDVIHSDRTQLQRDNVVKSFRAGKIWILICTELMGRGIDFKGVNLVINYDFPNSAISYIHRIGRTGRAGQRGKAITMFTEDDLSNLRSIANVMKEAGCPVPDYMLTIKKQDRKTRKMLAKQNPSREKIATDFRQTKKKSNSKSSGIYFSSTSNKKNGTAQGDDAFHDDESDSESGNDNSESQKTVKKKKLKGKKKKEMKQLKKDGRNDKKKGKDIKKLGKQSKGGMKQIQRGVKKRPKNFS